MLPVFFPPFDAEFFEFVENFLGRIFGEEFLGKNFWRRTSTRTGT